MLVCVIFTEPPVVSILRFEPNNTQGPELFEYQYASRVLSFASSTVTFNAGVTAMPVLLFAGISPIIVGAVFGVVSV